MQMQNEFILTETNMLEKTFKRTEPAANDHIGELRNYTVLTNSELIITYYSFIFILTTIFSSCAKSWRQKRAA